jgi:hypothetical protein
VLSEDDPELEVGKLEDAAVQSLSALLEMVQMLLLTAVMPEYSVIEALFNPKE